MVLNLRNKRELAGNVIVAERIFERLKGLIGRRDIDGSSLWLRPCNSIHTIGMKFPIDVLFLDGENRVVGIRERVPPNRLSRVFFRARTALELPAGTASSTQTEVGDVIGFVEAT